MARIIRLKVEHLPEGVYLATSDDVQGLVAQADTLPELLRIVPELVEMRDELRAERGWIEPSGQPIAETFEFSMLLGA